MIDENLMETMELKHKLSSINTEGNELLSLDLTNNYKVYIYPRSINVANKTTYLIGKEGIEKFLFLISNENDENYTRFQGDEISSNIKKCYLNTVNRKLLQTIFDFLNPVVIGLQNSFGFGDRLGLANAGHIKSLDISDFKPILTQQSIRELSRTKRTPDEVMDAAVWAVFQEGFKDGFGADADHLKTTLDIDLMVKAGYKMFTFDPSDYVDNNADNYNVDELNNAMQQLPWDGLKITLAEAEKKYLSGSFNISDTFKLAPNKEQLMKAYAKYGKAIVHIKELFDYLKNKYGSQGFDYEVEVSVDETESVTTPFEHFFFSNELNRLNVEFISLAPRFVGDFEKGIDYKGDLELFKEEYRKHLAITKYFGNYKISLHSGSDKFSVYKIIGSIKETYTHVKTAGTSYLEALKVAAKKEPNLFRKILDYACAIYENEKRTYHVSADINKLKPSQEYRNGELESLFDSNDIRQILHVTFGRILTDTDEKGAYLFKDNILRCLKENEETHYELLIKHFHKHLEPFNCH